MDLFGPFLVNGRAVNTGLSPQPGDKLSVLTSGILRALLQGAPAPGSVTADGLVTAGTPQLAPTGWTAPGRTRLSLVGHVNGQSIQLGDGLTSLPTAGQSVPLGGELMLDVNAPPRRTMTMAGRSTSCARPSASRCPRCATGCPSRI